VPSRVRHSKPSRSIWSNPGISSTQKRTPALVKQLPQIITPWGHLGTSGIIWKHLEISGPSGTIWSRNHILRIRILQMDKEQKCNFAWNILLFSILEASGAIWSHLWQCGTTRAIWNSPGSTLKRPPAPVKQFPWMITPCGHLGTSGIIWSHLNCPFVNQLSAPRKYALLDACPRQLK
jgi:hypothetical protein